MQNRILKSALLGVYTVVAAGASYGLIPHRTFEDKRTLEQEALISAKINQYTNYVEPAPEQPLDVTEELEHTVRSGESLSSIFSDLNLSREDLHKIVHANATGKQFADVAPGNDVVATLNADGELERLTYAKTPFETLIATRHDDEFDVELLSKKVDYQLASAKATIHASLFEDGTRAGLPEKLILKLADIFAWDIDFALNLREGDQFTVVYEKLFVDGKEFDSGDILSVEFVNQGKVYTAVRFEDNQGNTGYYTPEGNSLRKAFLQTPMDFAKISSHFDLHRKHPILNTIRAHKGVDYSAATGTPIKSTGDGKIIFKGGKNGYGNVVEIEHGQKYSTLYAHLSGFKSGLKTGGSVKQGEVIGYVGSTGLATGPHLHYEFRINGEHVNPLTVKLPHSLPMDATVLAKFKAQTQPLLAQLKQAKGEAQFAQN
ncbi:peptidoglycan DD-metalloendopeptidase family protein [Methylomonas sp. MED-D]|uniref:peptidoglycan DD-metalloendopeptidase family protein n=1 Tax=unclassified Methylomonas TaxID=2608980 RepID=UPI0028A44500|nr:peptidoglycan DD-metalloendopeptidase family protein [Methylomonas sp. MV1]MDT4332457.1 peptidoglycan DD-metalloendopeptidase family protein [Methylomonas sp. MV1]